MSLVVPAVLPSSRKDLEEKLSLFASLPQVERVQIDVVDGRFASPASWPYSAEAPKGMPYTAQAELRDMVEHGEMLPALERIAYEIDLMCLDAELAAGPWLTLGATRLTFHAESVTDLPHLLASIKKRYGGFVSCGLALNIASDLALIEPCIGEIEYVQFMGIARIGRQGQPFDRRVFEKVRVFHNRHPDIPVQVDGGISLPSARRLVAAGISNLIVGSGILKAVNPAEAFASFDTLQTSYGV